MKRDGALTGERQEWKLGCPFAEELCRWVLGRGPNMTCGLSRPPPALGCEKEHPSCQCCTVSTCHHQSYARASSGFVPFRLLYRCISLAELCIGPLIFPCEAGPGTRRRLGNRNTRAEFPTGRCVCLGRAAGSVHSLRVVAGLKSCHCCPLRRVCDSSCYGRACRSPHPRSRAL